MWNKRLLPYVAMTLLAAQLLLIFLSWIWSAAVPVSGVRSLLSEEGVRWFMGHYSDMLATPVLVWLLLGAMGWGCFRNSGLLRKPQSYRERRGLLLTAAFVICYTGIVLLLTVMPHAVLLSASGTLWPSPFSASIVPVVAFGLLSAGIVYGTVAGTYASPADVYNSLLSGLHHFVPLLLFYVLAAQLYFSFIFVYFRMG